MGVAKFVVVIALLVATAAAAWPCVTQTSEAQGVVVAVTPGDLDADRGSWDFAIAFQATGQRLDDEVLDAVVLVADGVRLKPLDWEGEPAGRVGHRAGVLKFAAIHPRPREMHLEITRPGESKPRVFTFVFGEWSA
jgi:hypothetical protein